jgi:hypothetical protein
VAFVQDALHNFKDDREERSTMTNTGLEVPLTRRTTEKWTDRNQSFRRFCLSSARRKSEREGLPDCFKMLRRLGIFLCVLGMPFVAHAQGNKTSWENLSGLAPGHKIQVVEMNSKKVSGTFVSVSDTAISVQDPSGEQTIQKTDVRVVKLMENKHRLRNAAIGAAVGAGVGAGIGAGAYRACKPNESFCIDPIGRAGVAGIVAAAGGAGGAIVGALWPSHQTLYRAPGK